MSFNIVNAVFHCIGLFLLVTGVAIEVHVVKKTLTLESFMATAFIMFGFELAMFFPFIPAG